MSVVNHNSQFVQHEYGQQVHILNDQCLNQFLIKLGQPHTEQPQLNFYVESIYETLLQTAINLFFPKKFQKYETRMIDAHSEAIVEGDFLDSDTRVVTVNLARAGALPSQVCYERLNYLFKPKNIRQDHVFVARKTNNNGQVTGVDYSGSKIGGDIENKIVLFPDPMGATGGTICQAADLYKKEVKGAAQKIIALHLIVTPEYIKRIKNECPEIIVLAARIDRGLSSARALAAMPGAYPEEEKGLNAQQYIVPGAGGVGELLNNSYC
ncbi:MAG: uracil phosphoribosyltransferase [Bdellovibrionales bacterium]|nr:uracil phosphoribosyltransferase [Bdellovibrionales bacterium]